MNFKIQLLGWGYRYLIRPLFFLIEPERIHDGMTGFGNLLGKFTITRKLFRWLFAYQHPSLRQTVAGIEFKNPVGLSAGFDKDAKLVQILPEVGFGFMQVGTVTTEAYEGNPPPRLWRLPRSKGLVVYYGLKNIGVKKIIKKMVSYMSQRNTSDLQGDSIAPLQNDGDNQESGQVPYFPISISIGKTNSKKTATQKAGVEDYYQCLKEFVAVDLGDFYTINISCPNTFGGEPFTTPKSLGPLLKKLRTVKTSKPMFLKMPINLEWKDFKRLLDIAVKYKISGLIIGNLNKDRNDPAIKDQIPDHVQGGVSGKPTWDLSNDLISRTYKAYGKKLIIIGVGGIFSAEDAYEKIKRGATLVQLITGMIYQGPQLIGEINRGLVELMNRDGYGNISQVIGTAP